MSNLEKDIETRKNKLDTTHYKNALNISGSGSCILDFQNKTFILSREACVILGFETKDGLVIPIHELIQKIIPGDRNKVEQIFSTFENSENLKTRFKIYKLEGDSKQQRIMYFVARKEKEYWTGIFQDITGFLEEEKEKIKEKTRENAAVVDKIKSTFLRNLSHEIRRPLNAIMGFTELLNMHDITPEKKQNYLRIINSNGNFLLKLVDDIAEVSSYSEGKLDINKTHFDVNKFLKEIFMQFKHVIKEKGKEHVELIFSNQMDTGEFKIYSDQGRIQQVLANLFSNAIKFTSKGSIEYGYEYIEEKNTIKFFMKDTGTGLDKEEQKNIFDWFSKTGDSFNKHFKGLGLGLMLSKGVVDSMDGKIWVDSNPGEGSTFHFSIPLGEERKIKKVTPPEQKNTYNWKDKVILIVEDEEVNQLFLEAIMQETQVKSIKAFTGEQAIELCKSINKIDLILMDIKLPGIDGITAIKEIKKINPRIPVIVQTAFTDNDNKNKCFQVGSSDYISKPINIELLLSKVNHLLYD